MAGVIYIPIGVIGFVFATCCLAGFIKSSNKNLQ